MSTVKLTYFDVRARGELARLVMAAAKQKYDDHRISFEEWGAMKPKSEFGSLPQLTINGENHFQGNAIATYLAREHGLYGKTNLDGLLIDQAVHLKEDTLQEEAKTVFGDDASKAEAAKKLQETVYPRSLSIWENLIKRNKSGYLCGSSLTLGDLAIFEGTVTISQGSPQLLDKYPAVKALREKVAATPGVKEYVEKRKQTPI